MSSLGRAFGIAFVVLGLGVGIARAQDKAPSDGALSDTCGLDRAALLELADRILAERTLAKGFSVQNFGTAAVYLKMRYSDLDLASGMSLLDHVEAGAKRAPRELDQVRLGFAISKQGVEKGLTANGQTAVEAFAEFSPVVVRQILLADAGESFFRLLAELRTDPERAKSFERQYYKGLVAHYWILDQSDDFKLRLARNAETAGELPFAAMVLGSRRDLAEYFALLERHKDSDLADLAGPGKLTPYLASIPHQTSPVPVPGDDAERKAWRADQFEIMRASFGMGGLAWLGILYNQTGADAPIARASRDFLAEIEAGRLDPRTDLEPAWAHLYKRLAEEMGAEELSYHMAAFNLPPNIRHYAGSAQTTLDWINARQALIPYLTGEEEQLPPRPALLTPEFDWQSWIKLATTLRNGSAGVLGGDASLAAELLLAKGNVTGALQVARGIMPNKDRLRFYRDVMIRLDQRCDGYTIYPGGELVMGGAILYRFD